MFRKIATGLAAVTMAASFAMPAAHAQINASPAVGLFQGLPVVALEVPNATIEGLPDAQLIGQITLFVPTDPAYLCMAGGTYNVWRAPAEYGSSRIVHNGWQGPQCTYGTWVF